MVRFAKYIQLVYQFLRNDRKSTYKLFARPPEEELMACEWSRIFHSTKSEATERKTL